MNTDDQNPGSIRARLAEVEQLRTRLLRELETKVSNLPGYLGLTNLEEVLDLVRTKNETGSVEAFAGAALPQRVEAGVLGRRRKQRGVYIGDSKKDQISRELLAGRMGIDIARELNISPSTVSNIRKELVESGRLKT